MSSSTTTTPNQLRKRPIPGYSTSSIGSNKSSSSRGGCGEKTFKWERLQKSHSEAGHQHQQQHRIHRDMHGSRSKMPPSQKITTLDSIKLTERIVNLCHSVDYIANIMKAKAQLDEVFKYYNNLEFLD